MSMAEEWKKYRDLCYTARPLPAEQNKQLHQAFFAGAFTYMQQIEAITMLPEEEAMVALSKLQREVREFVVLTGSSIQGRN